MDELELSVERGHMIETTVYDEQLEPTAARAEPKPGYQWNGHRADCRCETCRPDIFRLPDGGERRG